jgi:ribosomal-protein-alanine N-acetyltransferase
VLVVAAFNARAIRVYERAGFVETGRHMRHLGGRDWEFVDMELEDTPDEP